MTPPPSTSPAAAWTGAVAACILCLAGAWLLRAAMVPDLYYRTWILVVPGFTLVAALAWLVRAASLRHRGALRDRWSLAQLALWALVVAAVALHLPMRAGFLWVKHSLERAAEWELRVEGPVGPYTFATGPLRDHCATAGLMVFPLLDAGDMAAFVYAPGGIEDLCFDDGASGHLVGDWYWKVDD